MTRFKKIKSQKKKADLILLSDSHIREDTPICRTDDILVVQNKKIDFIFELARQNQCPIFIAGDIGNKPRWSCKLLEWFISKVINYNVKIFAIPGQHDLINHRLDFWRYSAIGVLHAAGAITLLGPDDLQSSLEFDNFYVNVFPYGKELNHIKILNNSKPQVAITHQMIIENKPLFPGHEAQKAHQLLKEFHEFSIVHSGDNHLPFTVEYQGRILVNPGSMMRNTADQIDHKPRVYLWYAESNKVEPVYLPIESDVISREHIKDTTERDNRFNALIDRVKSDVEIKLSYELNVEGYFQKFRTKLPVKEKVWMAVK